MTVVMTMVWYGKSPLKKNGSAESLVGVRYGLYMGYIWVIYGLYMGYIWLI